MYITSINRLLYHMNVRLLFIGTVGVWRYLYDEYTGLTFFMLLNERSHLTFFTLKINLYA